MISMQQGIIICNLVQRLKPFYIFSSLTFLMATLLLNSEVIQFQHDFTYQLCQGYPNIQANYSACCKLMLSFCGIHILSLPFPLFCFYLMFSLFFCIYCIPNLFINHIKFLIIKNSHLRSLLKLKSMKGRKVILPRLHPWQNWDWHLIL